MACTGTLPSGGSTTIDLRRSGIGLAWSAQCGAGPTPALAAGCRAAGRPAFRTACCRSSPTSPADRAGRPRFVPEPIRFSHSTEPAPSRQLSRVSAVEASEPEPLPSQPATRRRRVHMSSSESLRLLSTRTVSTRPSPTRSDPSGRVTPVSESLVWLRTFWHDSRRVPPFAPRWRHQLEHRGRRAMVLRLLKRSRPACARISAS